MIMAVNLGNFLPHRFKNTPQTSELKMDCPILAAIIKTQNINAKNYYS